MAFFLFVFPLGDDDLREWDLDAGFGQDGHGYLVHRSLGGESIFLVALSEEHKLDAAVLKLADA